MELDWLKRWSQYSPQAVAVQDGETGKTLTYSELFEQAQACAHLMSHKYEIRRGDRVLVFATNELETIVLFFALSRLGATLVPANFRLTSRELSYILKDSAPRLLITQEQFNSVLDSLDLPPRLDFEGADGLKSLIQENLGAQVDFLAESEDAAMIIYTSGTTGAPKGALISHRMLFWNSINTSLRLNISQTDRAVIFLPFFHTGAWNVLLTPILHRGGKIILLKKFDADLVLKLTDEDNCTLLFGVPTTMDMMAKTETFQKVSLKSLRYAIVGGEPMPIPLIETWHQKGLAIRQGYGLTEFGPNVFSLNEEDALRKKGSIGFANFYIDVKVVDDSGDEILDESPGELLLKGPMIMSGYWRNPQATNETIQNGWLHTGDLVRRDQDGYFYVVGRKKDMYKSGGENVYPAEVEQVLRQCPGVQEAAVIGVVDSKWGEVGKAFLVKSKTDLTESDVLSFCQMNLAKFKIPKSVEFLPELPKGDSGKILKRALRP